MARWFSDLFGRSGDPADGPGGSRTTVGTPDPVEGSRATDASERTVRIDRSKSSAKLAWPARDEKDSPRPQGRPAAGDRGQLGRSPEIQDPHEEPTRLVGSSADRPLSRRPPDTRAYPPEPADEPTDEMTRLVAPSEPTEHDPVVGWLVVIAGPGRGRSLEIGAGINSIGRAAGHKLALNFGDMLISREKHALLVYDPRSHRFFLNNGEVRNLTYVNDDVVLAPVELMGGETIAVGNTQLRFVRLCDADFNWS